MSPDDLGWEVWRDGILCGRFDTKTEAEQYIARLRRIRLETGDDQGDRRMAVLRQQPHDWLDGGYPWVI